MFLASSILVIIFVFAFYLGYTHGRVVAYRKCTKELRDSLERHKRETAQ